MGYNYRSIDEVLTGRLRLAVIAFLMSSKTSNFSELLKATQASKGNLGAQIRVLEAAEYIRVDRSKVGRRSHMVIKITELGRDAFQAHISYLQSLITETSDHA